MGREKQKEEEKISLSVNEISKMTQTLSQVDQLHDKVISLQEKIDQLETRVASKLNTLNPDEDVIHSLYGQHFDPRYEKNCSRIVYVVETSRDSKNKDNEQHFIRKVNTGETFRKAVTNFKSHISRYSNYRWKKEKRHRGTATRRVPNIPEQRASLLLEAHHMVQNHEEIKLVYADVHGNVKVRLQKCHKGKNVFTFDNIDSLKKLLLQMGLVP